MHGEKWKRPADQGGVPKAVRAFLQPVQALVPLVVVFFFFFVSLKAVICFDWDASRVKPYDWGLHPLENSVQDFLSMSMQHGWIMA